jgi:hypothetical protein
MHALSSSKRHGHLTQMVNHGDQVRGGCLRSHGTCLPHVLWGEKPTQEPCQSAWLRGLHASLSLDLAYQLKFLKAHAYSLQVAH